MGYSPFRHVGSIILKRRPIHLTFFLTRRCNARCPFCFYLRTAAPDRQHLPELTLPEIEKIAGSFGSLLWLAFSGGEIYLREDLPEISAIFYERNRPAIMLFPTNGMLPELIATQTERILRTCPQSIIAVKLSIDGVASKHDAVRATPGSFERTMRTYELLADLLPRFPNFELGVNTVFCSQNQDDMDEVIDFVQKMDRIRTHTVSLARGDLAGAEFKKVDLRKYFTTIERLQRNLRDGTSPCYRFRGARLKAAQDVLQRKLIHRTSDAGRRLIPCYAGRLNLVLSEDGEVFPCEILDASCGNIRDYGYDISRVMRSERAKEILGSISGGKCFCTHECYFMTNILSNPALYPALFREYLRLP